MPFLLFSSILFVVMWFSVFIRTRYYNNHLRSSHFLAPHFLSPHLFIALILLLGWLHLFRPPLSASFSLSRVSNSTCFRLVHLRYAMTMAETLRDQLLRENKPIRPSIDSTEAGMPPSYPIGIYFLSWLTTSAMFPSHVPGHLHSDLSLALDSFSLFDS